MARVLQMIDALPAALLPPDDQPLRDAMPGCWPDIGDLRRFIAENETLRAEREQSEKHRNDLMDSIVSLKTERGALKSRLADSDAERDAAIARAEEAKDRVVELGEYIVDLEHLSYIRADLTWRDEATRLRAKLTQAEGEIATMRTPRPLEEYHEDYGFVTWWKFPINEPSWIGSPSCSDWPCYHTHFTPHPDVDAPALTTPEPPHGD